MYFADICDYEYQRFLGNAKFHISLMPTPSKFKIMKIGTEQDQDTTELNQIFPMAARIRSGDMGSSVIRIPIASQIALAIAAAGGTIGTSPTPLTPYG